MPDGAAFSPLQVSGHFSARRKTDLSSLRLVGGLLITAALGIIAGLLLLGKLLADDMASRDRAQLQDVARISASRIDRLLLQAELDVQRLAPSISALGPQTSAEEIRLLRQSAVNLMQGGPLEGIAVFNGGGETVFEAASAQDTPAIVTSVEPLASQSTILSDTLRLVADRDPPALVLHFPQQAQDGHRVVGILNTGLFRVALAPEGDSGDAIHQSFLLDRENRVLLTGRGPSSTMSLQAPPTPYNLASLHEASVSQVTDSSGNDRLLATAYIAGQQLRVVHVSEAQGGAAVFNRAMLLLAAAMAPALLGVILLISVVQNEWRKSDRRANNASDAVARAEVASDLLQAGIVDWSTRDSSVAYTRGWRELFGYADSVTGEQVFDWIARIHPDDRQDARRRYQRLMDGEDRSADHTIRVLCADGSYANVRERAAVRTDEADAVVRIILVQTPFVIHRTAEAAA